MRYSVIEKDNEFSQEVRNRFINKMNDFGALYDDENPEVIVSIGGDGTMLRAIHKYIDKIDDVAFVGLHTGTLGFFTNYTVEDLDLLCDDLMNKEPKFDKYPLIEVLLDDNKKFYAVNEVRIENNFHTTAINITVNDQFLETFHGTGLVVSTAIGSTGINRSLIGPIVEPSLHVMILTEIAGIQHRFHSSLTSPLVMSRDTIIEMDMLNEDEHTIVGADHEVFDHLKFSHVKCRVSKKRFKMLNYHGMSYVKRLRKAFFEYSK